MMKTVIGMAAAAIYLHAGFAQAQEEITARPVTEEAPAAKEETRQEPGSEFRRDAGWNSPWALHFQLHNIFQNSVILSGFDNLNLSDLGFFGSGSQPSVAMIGGSYHLNPTMGVRAGVGLRRSSDPELIEKTTTVNGPNQEITYDYAQGTETDNSVNLRADVLMRLSEHIVAPYVGGGLFYEFQRRKFTAKDEVSTVNEISHANSTRTQHSLGVRGLLGAEWRIHSNFAFYAEYALAISLMQIQRAKDVDTVERTVNGNRTTSQTTFESDRTRALNWETGLVQGASFGLAVHFEP
jgi:opacity protein-like surface antigen